MKAKTKELSVFIDESGDTGFSPDGFYMFTLVFHNQGHDLNDEFKKIKNDFSYMGLRGAFHAGPLIRGEVEYNYLDEIQRHKIFNHMSKFISSLDISYTLIQIKNKEFKTKEAALKCLEKKLKENLNLKLEKLLSFDKIIIYYDDGQDDLERIIKKSFKNISSSYVYKQINPQNYFLFQAADMISTLEFTDYKFKNHILTNSDTWFFGIKTPYKDFKKQYMKNLRTKKFGD